MSASSSTRYNIGKKLGQGSFGTVHEGSDTTGRTVAIKAIPSTVEEGIASLFELSIYMTYSHPHLNEAVKIDTDEKRTYVIMNKADYDLEVCYKRELPSLATHRGWCHQLAQAVDCLHSEGIIHCDIKPSNCLVFDGKVKLTDYTLSVKKFAYDDIFDHSICTIHYRPPEVLLGRTWNESVDVWSLGCLFYTVATGDLLIPHQGDKLDTRLSDDSARQQLKRKNLASIIEWRSSIGDLAAQKVPITETNFNSVCINPGWERFPDSFKELVLKMTSFDAKQRPTIRQILKHEYFEGLTTYPVVVKGTAGENLDPRHERQIERIAAIILSSAPKINTVSLSDSILKLSKDIYRRCIRMTDGVSDGALRIETCIWIANKLLTGVPPTGVRAPLHKVLAMEKRICKYLDYRLHVVTSDQLLTLI